MTRSTAGPNPITDRQRLEDLCAEVAAEEFYGIDTEFHTERTYYPQLALIQLAWRDQVALVDPLAVDPGPLAHLFSGPGVAVAHAAEQDLQVLTAACGATPATVFDTQIVAGFLGLSSPSLARLADQILGVSLPKADRLSDWIHRPISDRQLTYAANDVAYLLELRAVLSEKLAALGRLEWALEECAQVLGDQPRTRVPEESWWKMGDVRSMSGRARAVAQEVAAWRERKAAATDRPRRTVLSDLGLLAVAQRPPRDEGELRNLRGVDGRHLAQRGAAAILEAVHRGLNLPPGELRLPPEGKDALVPPAALAVCTGLVRHIADNLSFDQGLLATRADIAQRLSGGPSRLDTGWRRAIAGDPLDRLIAGEVAVTFGPEGTLVLEERSFRASPFS
ncbi:MAG TPA: HRDC domain-containing protein [Acidimicrobiales bacterium]|nr:HRDC domain-containing protein [Acidimicrobiales bacterium]